jgi:hypothetical protein
LSSIESASISNHSFNSLPTAPEGEEENELNVDTVEPGDDEEDNEETTETIGITELIINKRKIYPTKHREGFTNIPSIGSVELGKVPLLVTKRESGKLTVSPGRQAYQFHSGQTYLPIFKVLTNKTAMNRQKNLGALPAMISNLMLPTLIRTMSAKERELINELVDMLVDVYMNYSHQVEAIDSNNCLRSEYYHDSKFNTQEKDWIYPTIPFTDFLLISRQNSYLKTVRSMLSEAIGILKRVLLTDRRQVNYDELSGPAKNIVVVTVEMGILMCEFSPFHPKGMTMVNKTIKAEKEKKRTD